MTEGNETIQVIIVVDDEILIAKTLSKILDRAGYGATAYSSPEEALQGVYDLKPDLLITDVRMPKMTGVELAIRVQNAKPDCKILLFSGKDEAANFLAETLKNGHDFELLAKPIHPADLLAKLKR